MRTLVSSLSLLSFTLYLTGCGFTADTSVSPISPTGKGTHGHVHGGQQPVVGATVTVWSVGIEGSPTALASTTSDSNGNFAFNTEPSNSYTCSISLAKAAPVSAHQVSSPHPRSSASKSAGDVKIGGGATGATRSTPAILPSSTETYLYITATGGSSGTGSNSSIALGAGLGPCTDAQTESVEINEVSTAILAYVMANFTTGSLTFESSNDPHQINAMEIALTNTFQTLDDLPTGTVKPSTVSTTGGTSITIEAAKIYSIANTIASCVNSADQTTPTPGPSSACETLFADASIPNQSGPPTQSTDTFIAALFMCFAPYNNVTALYNLGVPQAPFPGLSTAPNDWSLAISYSTTALGFNIYQTVLDAGAISSMDLDSNDRVWFPSNKSGAVGIAYFDPTDNTFNGPYGATGNYPLTLPQYVALDDANQIAWATDDATNHLVGVSTGVGTEGTILYEYYFYNFSPGSSPYGLGPLFVDSDSSVVFNFDNSFGVPQAIAFNPFTITDTAESAFTLQPSGMTLNTTGGVDPNDPTAPLVAGATSNYSTCDVELTSLNDGDNVIISNNSSTCLSGGIATTAYDANTMVQDEVSVIVSTDSFCSVLLAECGSAPEVLDAPVGVAVDGGNEVWFANSGNASLYYGQGIYDSGGNPSYNGVSPVDLLHGSGYGGTMTYPTAIAVDRGGNVWVSNLDPNCATTCTFTLSELFGVGYPTITPLSLQANQLQGTQPTTNAGATPVAMLRHTPSPAHGSATAIPLIHK
jgi:hypothetical protein